MKTRIIIRYTLLDAHSETTLKLRPFLAFRCVREYTHENTRVNRDYQEVPNGIKTCMYDGYPELYMQLNKKNDFVFSRIGIVEWSIRKNWREDMPLMRISMCPVILN